MDLWLQKSAGQTGHEPQLPGDFAGGGKMVLTAAAAAAAAAGNICWIHMYRITSTNQYIIVI